MSNNLGLVLNPVHETQEERYHYFDKLPPPLRRLFQYAPYDYAVRGAFEQWMRERGVYTDAEIVRNVARGMMRHRRQSVIQLYGPDHPQARV